MFLEMILKMFLKMFHQKFLEMLKCSSKYMRAHTDDMASISRGKPAFLRCPRTARMAPQTLGPAWASRHNPTCVTEV